MAYMSQKLKKELSPAIKAAFKKFGIKGSIGVHHHSTLEINIRSGALDLLGNYDKIKKEDYTDRDFGKDQEPSTYLQANEYYLKDSFSDKCLNFLLEIKDSAMVGNHDHSDIMTDYFDVGWHISINIGKWDKPYICTK